MEIYQLKKELTHCEIASHWTQHKKSPWMGNLCTRSVSFQNGMCWCLLAYSHIASGRLRWPYKFLWVHSPYATKGDRKIYHFTWFPADAWYNTPCYVDQYNWLLACWSWQIWIHISIRVCRVKTCMAINRKVIKVNCMDVPPRTWLPFNSRAAKRNLWHSIWESSVAKAAWTAVSWILTCCKSWRHGAHPLTIPLLDCNVHYDKKA